MDNLNWDKDNQKVGSIVGHADGYSFLIENVSPNRWLGYPQQISTVVFEGPTYPTIEEAQAALTLKLKESYGQA